MKMKMKKNLFILAVAAVALAACSSDDTIAENSKVNNSPKEIAFKSLAYSSTRGGTGSQSGSLDAAYDMYVAAYQTNPNTADYFGETQFVNYESGKWHGATSRYWPLSVSTLNFLAVTSGPGSTTRAWGSGSTPANYASKVVVTMDDNSSAQHDMMWAIGQGSVTQSTSLSFPEVSMAFKHTLALVKFTEKVTSTASGKIKLTSITLNDAYYNGIVTIENSNYDNAKDAAVESVTPVWDVSESTDKDVTVPGWAGSASALTNTAEFAPVGNGLMIIPPTSGAAFSGFTVAYQIKNPDTDTWQSYSYTYAPTTPTGRALSQGYQYTYNITFNLNEIIIAPTVDAWGTGTGGSITIQ